MSGWNVASGMVEPLVQPTREIIALVGFMGAGKSTLAARLAARLGLPCREMDQLLEEETGQSIAEFFKDFGEGRFREVEADLLRRIFGEGPAVISTGGGCVESETNRILLHENATVVWLDLPIEAVRSRIGRRSPGQRPLLDQLGWDGLSALLDRRRPLYSACSHWRIDAGRGPLGRQLREIEKCVREGRS